MALDVAAERRCLDEWLPFLWSRNLQIRSPTDHRYNCIAWAAEDDTKIWSPAVGVGGKMLGGYFWPRYAPVLPTVAATEMVFEGRGYVRTDIDDIRLEEGVEKVAIFGYDAMNFVTHAARQCPSGLWTSKMGDCGDIEHALRDVESTVLGEVRSVMRKDRKVDAPATDLSLDVILVEHGS